LQKALIATLSNMKRYDETIVQATRYIERYGDDLTMLDALKVAYFYIGDANIASTRNTSNMRSAFSMLAPRKKIVPPRPRIWVKN
jgi:hypothetical protein